MGAEQSLLQHGLAGDLAVQLNGALERPDLDAVSLAAPATAQDTEEHEATPIVESVGVEAALDRLALQPVGVELRTQQLAAAAQLIGGVVPIWAAPFLFCSHGLQWA